MQALIEKAKQLNVNQLCDLIKQLYVDYSDEAGICLDACMTALEQKTTPEFFLNFCGSIE
jgi:hypothetical protein